MDLEHFEHLLLAELDGELTPDERDELDAACADDPRLKRIRDQDRELVAMLREGKTERAPAGLAGTVMDRIERGDADRFGLKAETGAARQEGEKQWRDEAGEGRRRIESRPWWSALVEALGLPPVRWGFGVAVFAVFAVMIVQVMRQPGPEGIGPVESGGSLRMAQAPPPDEAPTDADIDVRAESRGFQIASAAGAPVNETAAVEAEPETMVAAGSPEEPATAEKRGPSPTTPAVPPLFQDERPAASEFVVAQASADRQPAPEPTRDNLPPPVRLGSLLGDTEPETAGEEADSERLAPSLPPSAPSATRIPSPLQVTPAPAPIGPPKRIRIYVASAEVTPAPSPGRSGGADRIQRIVTRDSTGQRRTLVAGGRRSRLSSEEQLRRRIEAALVGTTEEPRGQIVNYSPATPGSSTVRIVCRIRPSHLRAFLRDLEGLGIRPQARPAPGAQPAPTPTPNVSRYVIEGGELPAAAAESPNPPRAETPIDIEIILETLP